MVWDFPDRGGLPHGDRAMAGIQKFPLTLELAVPATILGVRHELNFL